MMSLSFLKYLFVGGGILSTVSTIPNIIDASTSPSGVGSGQQKNNNSIQKEHLFSGNLAYGDGEWNLKDFCFYYDGRTGGDIVNIIGFPGTKDREEPCGKVRVYQEEDAKGSSLKSVKVSFNLDDVDKKDKSHAVWKWKGKDGKEDEIIGCIEVNWWRRGGQSANGVIVGNSFLINGDPGCTSSVYKRIEKGYYCNGACKGAWDKVTNGRSADNWDKVWTKDFNQVKDLKDSYGTIESDKTRWVIETL